MRFTDLRNITTKHNLAVGSFAYLIGTTMRSIRKYISGDDSLREDTKYRIERGIELLEKSGIVWPSRDGIEFNYFRMESWREQTRICNERFKKFIEEQLAQNT